jgi:hypothetical protein
MSAPVQRLLPDGPQNPPGGGVSSLSRAAWRSGHCRAPARR